MADLGACGWNGSVVAVGTLAIDRKSAILVKCLSVVVCSAIFRAHHIEIRTTKNYYPVAGMQKAVSGHFLNILHWSQKLRDSPELTLAQFKYTLGSICLVFYLISIIIYDTDKL